MPRLVILDVIMPKMDGLEVCRRIREWSQVPIIVLSGRVTLRIKRNCSTWAPDDYLSKPFSIEELVARVEAVLRRTSPGKTADTEASFTTGDLEINFAESHAYTMRRWYTDRRKAHRRRAKPMPAQPRDLTPASLRAMAHAAGFEIDEGRLEATARLARQLLGRLDQAMAHVPPETEPAFITPLRTP